MRQADFAKALLATQFAGLQITEQIGAGGYGRVFRAHNLRLNRFEALKVFHPGVDEVGTVRRRFERGASGLAIAFFFSVRNAMRCDEWLMRTFPHRNSKSLVPVRA